MQPAYRWSAAVAAPHLHRGRRAIVHSLGSSRTGRLPPDRSSAAHRPRQMPPLPPWTRRPRIAGPHHNRHHILGPGVPRRCGCGSVARAWASAHSPPASRRASLYRGRLRQRLSGPLIGELRRTGPDHLAHRVPRYSQLPADLLDRLLVLKIRPPDLRYRLYDQHPTLCSPMTSGASSTSV